MQSGQEVTPHGTRTRRQVRNSRVFRHGHNCPSLTSQGLGRVSSFGDYFPFLLLYKKSPQIHSRVGARDIQTCDMLAGFPETSPLQAWFQVAAGLLSHFCRPLEIHAKREVRSQVHRTPVRLCDLVTGPCDSFPGIVQSRHSLDRRTSTNSTQGPAGHPAWQLASTGPASGRASRTWQPGLAAGGQPWSSSC